MLTLSKECILELGATFEKQNTNEIWKHKDANYVELIRRRGSHLTSYPWKLPFCETCGGLGGLCNFCDDVTPCRPDCHIDVDTCSSFEPCPTCMGKHHMISNEEDCIDVINCFVTEDLEVVRLEERCSITDVFIDLKDSEEHNHKD